MAEYKQMGEDEAFFRLHDLRHGYVVRRVSDLGSFQASGILWVSVSSFCEVFEAHEAVVGCFFCGHAC